MPRSKRLAQKNTFYSVVLGFKAETFLQHLTKYVKLNSLSHDLYLRVIWIQFKIKLFKIFFTDKIDLKNRFSKMLVIEYFDNP